MGIFQGLFGSHKSDIEKRLEESYYQSHKQFGTSRKEIQDAIKECKRKAKVAGDSSFGKNFGEELINRAREGDKDAIKAIQKRIEGGANEEDIINWWRLHYLERRMIKWEDDFFRITTFMVFKDERGFSDEEASQEIRKSFALYGDTMDVSNTAGEDRPLPTELHNRINRLVSRLNTYDQQRSREYSSMNAFLRHELKIKKI